jgi:hypothetical protein
MITISNQLEQLLLNLSLVQKKKDSETIDFEIKNSPVIFRSGVKVNFKTFFDADTHERLEKIKPDAVYHFDKEPLMLFFDLKKNDKRNIETIKKQCYNFDKPVIFILEFGKPLAIFNAFSYSINDKKKLELAEITNNENGESNVDKFSFWNLQSGNTWEWFDNTFFSKKRKTNNRVHAALLSNISTLREILKDVKDIDILILRLIFIRYLIDRNVQIHDFITFQSIEEGQNKLNDLISNKTELERLFLHFNTKFNGNLFKEKVDFSQKILTTISQIFAGNYLKDGSSLGYLFNIFDFSIIPIETISGIYEAIIAPKQRKEDSAIYTPLFLANYMLDKTINNEYFETKGTGCKVLDPSCGSGIFLVQAFRRMVYWEKKLEKVIDNELLTKVLTNNIFGIDRNPQALNVAIFSLYIAFLDFKTPSAIEANDNIFPNLLDENLFEADFFDTEADFNKKFSNVAVDNLFSEKNKKPIIKVNLDFIIGNPPWGSKKDKKLDKYHLAYIKEKNLGNIISDAQIAQTFTLRIREFANSNTVVSFVLTSKAFYNSGATDFKKLFFEDFLVAEILDMSAARRIIFENAIPPALVVRYAMPFNQELEKNKEQIDKIKQANSNNIVTHYSLKPNVFTEKFRKIVIDDTKSIKQSYFIEYDFMLKLALYGSAVDFNLLRKIFANKEMSTIGEFLKENAIISGTGFIKGDKDRKKDASSLYKILVVSELLGNNFHIFANNYTTFEKIKKYQDKKAQLPLQNITRINGLGGSLYAKKHLLLVNRSIDKSVEVAFADFECAFPNTIFGFHSENSNVLKFLGGVFCTKLFAYLNFFASSQWGIERDEIFLKDYLNNLIPKNITPQTIDLFVAEFDRLKTEQTNEHNFEKLVKQLYQTNNKADDMVDYVLDIAVPLFRGKKEVYRQLKLNKEADKTILRNKKTDKDILEDYAQVFYKEFGEVYNSPKGYFQVQIFVYEYFIAMKFAKILKKPSAEEQIIFIPTAKQAEKQQKTTKVKQQSIVEVEATTDNNAEETVLLSDFFAKIFSNFSIYEISEDVFIQQNFSGFEDNFFYIIKPNQLKSWHKAKAYADINYFIDEIDAAEQRVYGK